MALVLPWLEPSGRQRWRPFAGSVRRCRRDGSVAGARRALGDLRV